jgi:hypothetical protein
MDLLQTANQGDVNGAHYYKQLPKEGILPREEILQRVHQKPAGKIRWENTVQGKSIPLSTGSGRSNGDGGGQEGY